MRRSSDKVALACVAVCILCVAVTAFVIAPAVLSTSKLSTTNARLVRENAARTRETASLARKTASLARAIQEQRADSIRSGCREQNRRHDRTIAKLDALLVKRVKTAGPTERVRLKMSRESTVQLIETLAPRRDCAALVQRSAPTP